MKKHSELSSRRHALTLALFFASGFAGLVYEVLWMKELALLFGNTSQAAATTLTAFFLGLVAGAWYWGKRSRKTKRPLRAYALLEVSVALSALLYFVLLDLYYEVYGSLFQAMGSQRSLFVAVKFLLALGVLLPPSFFMGGTLPMVSQYLVRQRELLGRTASLLYAVNTVGAALGAYAAGFHLPRLFGYTGAYTTAIVTTTLVAFTAWFLGGEDLKEGAFETVKTPAQDGGTDLGRLSPRDVRALALFSGFASLGLEVLWTRMFAQVFQNSVYSFATILVMFLLTIALGAGLATWLIRKRYTPQVVLAFLLSGAALLVGTTPIVFHEVTGGLQSFGGQEGYLMGSFGTAASVMLLPGLFLGAIFPYLLRLSEPFARSAGRSVGDLMAVNTVGAAIGSWTAGFVMIDLLGLWSSIRFLAIAYACAALWTAYRMRIRSVILRALPVGSVLLLVSILDPTDLPVVRVDEAKGEHLVRVWEDGSGIVSVVRDPSSLTMRLDNSYAVGGTGAAAHEERQAHLPLLLHPDPQAVFFLGMGTGITAGAALDHPVERIVVAELGSNIIEASRTFFRPYVNGLFDDPRVRVLTEDGRNHLFASTDIFDVIVSDLFVPWKAGVGSLYSLEHYEVARTRLKRHGLYVQWLPLYQMSLEDVSVIARTMVEVFPRVTLWRGILATGFETAALIGHQTPQPMELDAIARRFEESADVSLWENSTLGREGRDARELLVRYAGNVTAARALFESYPVNTDDRPVIEYAASATSTRRLIGEDLLNFLGAILTAVPPRDDPYLAALTPRELGVVRAGFSLQLASALESAGNEDDARIAREMFSRLYGERATSPPGQ